MARLCVILGFCIAGVSAEDNATLPVATTQPHASLPRIREEAQRSESIVEPPQRSESIVDSPLEPPPPPEPKRTHAPEPTRTDTAAAGSSSAVKGAWSCARARGAADDDPAVPARRRRAPKWRDAATRYVQPTEGPWTWRIADHRPPVLLVRAATGKVSRVACASDDRCARFFTETGGGWRFQASEPVCVRGAALDASDEPPHGWARGAGGALLFIQASALASTKRSRALVGAVTAAALAAHYADATASVSIPITWQRGAAGLLCTFLSLRCVPVSAIVALLALAAAAFTWQGARPRASGPPGRSSCTRKTWRIWSASRSAPRRDSPSSCPPRAGASRRLCSSPPRPRSARAPSRARTTTRRRKTTRSTTGCGASSCPCPGRRPPIASGMY